MTMEMGRTKDSSGRDLETITYCIGERQAGEVKFRHEGDFIDFDEIYVEPEFRRRGIGTDLGRRLQGIARERDVRIIRALADTNNHAYENHSPFSLLANYLESLGFYNEGGSYRARGFYVFVWENPDFIEDS